MNNYTHWNQQKDKNNNIHNKMFKDMFGHDLCYNQCIVLYLFLKLHC